MEESSHSLRMLARVGARDPVHSTALGKAMLSRLPEDRWDAHFPTPLAGRTQDTITSVAALHEELRVTRERGFAIDRGENEADSMCIGAPIIGLNGSPSPGSVLPRLAPDFRQSWRARSRPRSSERRRTSPVAWPPRRPRSGMAAVAAIDVHRAPRHGRMPGARRPPVSALRVLGGATDVRCELGECPTWDRARERLYWVDIPCGAVHCLDGSERPQSGTTAIACRP